MPFRGEENKGKITRFQNGQARKAA